MLSRAKRLCLLSVFLQTDMELNRQHRDFVILAYPVPANARGLTECVHTVHCVSTKGHEDSDFSWTALFVNY